MSGGHEPVMLREVVDALRPRDGTILIDGTFGAGGYSAALLCCAGCQVYAIDRDPDALAEGAELARASAPRLHLIRGRFGDMDALLRAEEVSAVDGVTLDLGLSSMQLDRAERGFSIQNDGPLDMRMEKSGPSAGDLVNDLDEETLADIIYRYGEERHSRRIARAIVAARGEGRIERTRELAAIIRRAMPRAKGKAKAKGHGAARLHPATRTFQALRIYVNGELEELDRGLAAAERLLRPEGRLAIVSFHSLEDRAVKRFLHERGGARAQVSRHIPPVPDEARAPSFYLPRRGAQKPSAEEVARNPRARSARLRVAVRTEAAPWSEGMAA